MRRGPPGSDPAWPDVPLAWRPGRAVRVSDDGAEVWSFGGDGPVRLAGTRAGVLARAVDGTRPASHLLAAAVRGGMSASDAERVLGMWLSNGHLQPVSPVRARRGVTVLTAAVDDDVERVALASDADALVAALAALGLDVAAAAPDAAITVLVLPDLLALARCRQPATPVVGVSVRGDRAFVTGVMDGTSPRCPTCLDARLRLRRAVDVVAAERLGRSWPPVSPVRHPAAVGLAAGVVAAIVEGDDARTPTELTVIDPAIGRVAGHRVVPVAGCATCDPGGATVVASHLHPPEPVEPGRRGEAGSQVLGEQGSGGFRVVDPDETWQRYAPLISDVVGVVPFVRLNGPTHLRAFSAGANVAASEDLVLMRSRLRSASGGKGISLAAARTGALAEALERHSLRALGGEPHLRRRISDLPGPAVLPNDIQLFSEAQLDRAAWVAAWNLDDPLTSQGFHPVPERFDPEAAHDWSPVTEWRSGQTHWLPSSMLWFGWPGIPPRFPAGSSNGAAAGNTVPEALLQGALELVERDSVALWWHPRCHRPAFDLDAWDDPRIDAALAMQRTLGGDVWVLDVTSDLGIPAAVAVATDWTTHTRAPLLGFGAHLDPALAVVRALTELAQMQAPVIASEGQLLHSQPGTPEAGWFTEVTVESEPWLAPHGVAPTPATPTYADVDEAIVDLVARLADGGLRLLWADCTRPDVGLPVVRTWAPGLRHFWNRYAPGRLYDVPPALGWCEPGYTEADLNPRPMIL